MKCIQHSEHGESFKSRVITYLRVPSSDHPVLQIARLGNHCCRSGTKRI